jgi:hypothetical protein
MNLSITIEDIQLDGYTDDELHQQYDLTNQIVEYYISQKKSNSDTSTSDDLNILEALIKQAEHDKQCILSVMKHRNIDVKVRTSKLVEVPQHHEQDDDQGADDEETLSQHSAAMAVAPKVIVTKIPADEN